MTEKKNKFGLSEEWKTWVKRGSVNVTLLCDLTMETAGKDNQWPGPNRQPSQVKVGYECPSFITLLPRTKYYIQYVLCICTLVFTFHCSCRPVLLMP